MNRPVQQCFDRGASSYLQLAKAQMQMTDRLWALRPSQATQVLDLGCGPGHWSQRLLQVYPNAQVTGVDLSPGMLQQARLLQPDICWIQADAASLPLADQSMDFIFSSLMLQWCPQPLRVFAEVRRLLCAGGKACVATLLPGSLKEIQQAWQQADRPSQLLPFVSAEDYKKMAQQAGFTAMKATEITEVFYYADARSLLTSVAGVGAGAATRTQHLSKAAYQAIVAKLENQRVAAGLPLTYQLLLLELFDH